MFYTFRAVIHTRRPRPASADEPHGFLHRKHATKKVFRQFFGALQFPLEGVPPSQHSRRRSSGRK
eukprot:5407657-Pyramimonas_sp.AAC.1